MKCLLVVLLLALVCLAVAAQPDVPRYTKFEAAWTLPNQIGNPFDPRDNDVQVVFHGPSGLRAIVPAFWDGDRWRVRYAPTQAGAYTLTVIRAGQTVHPADLTADHFHCIHGAEPGFVRRDPKVVQRFVFDNGQSYYPLGMNAAWTGGRDADYPEAFARMNGAGMNWARVWMTFWDGKALEWSPDRAKNPKPGYFLMAAAQKIDRIFDAAAMQGVYVQLTLQHHGQYTTRTDPNWRDNPFNAANGGFLQHPDDFFTDPEARRLTRAKYRYIVARWGYSAHLMGWELFNEVQNIGEASGHFGDVVAWHKEMAAFLRATDVNHHLITTSVSLPGQALGSIGLDYLQSHDYPPDILTTFASVRTAGVEAPIFHGEWGPGGGTPLSEQNLHDGLWASLMAPTAGAGQYWFWDQVEGHNWWPQFASASGYVRASGLSRGGDFLLMLLTVDAPGHRSALSFAPPDGWNKTTRTDVMLSSDGQTPDLSGVSSFIQGNGHRDMLPQPIQFHLQCAAPCRFQITLGTISQAGAHPTLSLDGKLTAETEFAPSNQDHDANQPLSVDVPAGVHTVSLFNTGPDWFVVRQISVTNYVPSVAVLAKGDAHTVFFWAYTRNREDAPRSATLTLNSLAPGRYQVRLWAPWQGHALSLAPILHNTSGMGDERGFTLPAFSRDIAGVVQPVRP